MADKPKTTYVVGEVRQGMSDQEKDDLAKAIVDKMRAAAPSPVKPRRQ